MSRLDVWLDVACLFKTRSEAQKACAGGKVDVNGHPAKPHKILREGDALTISRPFGRKQTVIVRALAEHHMPKTLARELYEDTTPPPTPEQVEQRRLERAFRAAMRHSEGRPTTRQRRQIRRLKEQH